MAGSCPMPMHRPWRHMPGCSITPMCRARSTWPTKPIWGSRPAFCPTRLRPTVWPICRRWEAFRRRSFWARTCRSGRFCSWRASVWPMWPMPVCTIRTITPCFKSFAVTLIRAYSMPAALGCWRLLDRWVVRGCVLSVRR